MKQGDRFGKLVAIEFVKKDKFNHPIWSFKCDCGNSKNINIYSVSRGHTKSCGCLSKELNRSGNFRHKGCGTRLYRIWKGIRSRCNSKESDKNYKWYKNIELCEEWNSFENFRDWAMRSGYSDELTIDRIDSKGNYEPTNCRWATYKEQSNNRCSNKFYSAFGETHSINEWCDITGLARCTIYVRLKNFGGDFEKAISTTPRKKEVV